MDGIINVYKEAGYTSHDVVARLRGILGQKKIGHTGTLDPEATGVLPVCCGKATKVCGLLADKDKSYRAVCRLGVTTDTQDMTGRILKESDFSGISFQEILDCIQGFQGDILQIPPMYSALKVNGRKLYELAREGKTVERKARPVRIQQLEVTEWDLEQGLFTMEVTCSKGTYIRTLCHDIGERLGCGAAMESLVRTRVALFTLEEALPLWKIEELVQSSPELLDQKMYSVDQLFPDHPRLRIREKYRSRLANGNPLSLDELEAISPQKEIRSGDRVLIYDEHCVFRAVYQKEGAKLRVYKMF